MDSGGVDECQTACLHSSLLCKGASVEVTLTDTHISWESKATALIEYKSPLAKLFMGSSNLSLSSSSSSSSGSSSLSTSVPLCEIIRARAIYRSSSLPAASRPSEPSQDVCPTVTENGLSALPLVFEVWYVKRGSGRVWKAKRCEFTAGSVGECLSWVSAIQQRLLLERDRPKRLLVFINPYGGRKKGPHIYTSYVEELFRTAQIHTSVITTSRPREAEEYLKDLTNDMSEVDGIVVVGGDGMFSEVLNGLLSRYNSSTSLNQPTVCPVTPPVRVGIIPAGSTDTVSFCTIGTNDPVTAALHVILGDRLSIDVTSVRDGLSEKHIRFGVSMLGYGFYGDVLSDSERLRWMGPPRYGWSGIKTFLARMTYEAVVSYLPAQKSLSAQRPFNVTGRCYSGCDICKYARSSDLVPKHSSSTPNLQTSATEPYSHTHAHYASHMHSVPSDHPPPHDPPLPPPHGSPSVCNGTSTDQVVVAPVHRNCASGKGRRSLIPNGMSFDLSQSETSYSPCTPGLVPTEKLCEGVTDVESDSIQDSLSALPERRTHAQTNGVGNGVHLAKSSGLHEPCVGADGWEVVQGRFIGVNSVTMSCRCEALPVGLSPACHLGDGCTDLMFIKEASRFNYLRHLIRSRSVQANQFDFDFVQVVRVKEFKLRVPGFNNELSPTAPATASVWNCDGEVIHTPNIDAKVHCQLISLFARGIEPLSP